MSACRVLADGERTNVKKDGVDGTGLRDELVAKATKIGAEFAAPNADAVDREARFPIEAIDALRKEKMLSVFVPKDLGGLGCSVSDLSAICYTLGLSCSATAMVYAMHQIQAACIVRHGHSSPYFQQYMRDMVAKQTLIASATSEVGVGGDVRTSICAVETTGSAFKLEKNAPVISYGEHADDILATARRAPDAAANDQVSVLVRRDASTLERTGGWDTLGMRGTCSNGYKLKSAGNTEQILPTPYSEISSNTMLPVSHIVWTSLWLGIATDAVNRARQFIRGEARKKPGHVPPGALRLAEAMNHLQTMRATVHDGVHEYERLIDDPDALTGIGFAIKMNMLKVSASQLAVEITSEALSICGMAGYKSDSKFSIGRHVRDAYGAMLMINNDRILAANAQLLLIHKDA